jgi:hypothetical protein
MSPFLKNAKVRRKRVVKYTTFGQAFGQKNHTSDVG